MRRVAVLIAAIAAACGATAAVASADAAHCVSIPPGAPQVLLSGAVGQDVFLTEQCSYGNGGTFTYTAEPSGVSVTVRMSGSFRSDPLTGGTRFVGVFAIVKLGSGDQIVNAGKIDYAFPVLYEGRFDSAPDIEFASYAPVVQAFRLLLDA